MKKTLILSILSLALFVSSGYSEKPKLVKGENFFVLPVLSEGLCVHNIFQTGMVMPRDTPIRVWGWAKAGEDIKVTFDGLSEVTTAKEDRKWMVTFPA